MKTLHLPNQFSWSIFDEPRNLDFHGYALVRDGGNVVVDPVAMSEHDVAHLASLGGVTTIVVTNSDHVRAAPVLRERFGARVVGPAAERDSFPIVCDAYVAEGDVIAPGIEVLELHGSKTPGELALLVDRATLITGDLVRAHRGGRLALLPNAKLRDRSIAVESVKRLAAIESIDAVLVGDGWPVFRDGHRALGELVAFLDRG